MGLIKKLGKKKLFILFGSIAGVIVIACVLIISGVFKKKDKGPGYDIPKVPDGYFLVFRLVSEYDVADGEKTPITLCEYDKHGNLLVEKLKYRLYGDDEFDRITEYSYNDQDKPVRVQTVYADGDVRTEEFTYDSDGRETQCAITQDGGTKTICSEYDESGNLVFSETFDEDGKRTESAEYENDENGFTTYMDVKTYSGINLIHETIVRWTRRPNGSIEKLSYLERDYDVNGISSETELVTSFDKWENVIAEACFDNGERRYGYVYECIYDEDGRLKEYIGPSGTTDYYEYDKNGRVVSIKSWDVTTYYVYDSYGNVIKEYTTENGQDPADVTEYTEYKYQPFAVRMDQLTDDEYFKLFVQ